MPMRAARASELDSGEVSTWGYDRDHRGRLRFRGLVSAGPGGETLWACQHRHLSSHVAQGCADRQLAKRKGKADG